VNRSVLTCSKATVCPDTSSTNGMLAFNTTNVSQSAVGAASAAEQANIVNFALGTDVANPFPLGGTEKPGNAGKVRPSVHGDVTHSRPLPVNYGGSDGVVVFYGANDGTFRATSGATGQELWAFIAPEHHSKLRRLARNEPLVLYPSTPPFVVPTPQRKDYFFDGSAGLFQTFQDPPNETLAKEVLVFPTMRRGGRMVQGFDVSVPTKPVLMWRRGCPNPGDDTDCVAGYEEMGQTWSFPNVAFIRGHSSTEPVIIMGGGYDPCEDEDTSFPSACGNAKGRRVFVIEARSGTLLASFKTDASVIADVTLVDLDFDGMVDHGYAVDTAGGLYRIDFAKPGSHAPLGVADWSITKLAFTTGAGRKFQFGPAVLASSSEVFLAFGSGDRERPLEVNYPFKEDVVNRFYMFRDKFPDPASSPAVDLDTTLTDQTSASSACGAVQSINSLGWFIDLKNGRGEQTVTSAVIFGGLIFFSTNRPISAPPGACASNLGEASGYAVNLLNASGAVGTEAICGGQRSGVFVGGGLPPSPVTGIVPIDGKPVTVMIGGIQRSGGASSPIGAQKVKPAIAPKRSRSYWFSHGDK
jgi:type IV pilus assembly protein PilY1